MKIPRCIVLRDGVVAKFPWIVIHTDDREPALWQHIPQVGKVPLRFRTEALARAAAEQLNAEQRKT